MDYAGNDFVIEVQEKESEEHFKKRMQLLCEELSKHQEEKEDQQK